MARAGQASAERQVLRACAQGEVSPEVAFEELHRIYAPTVRAWLRLRAPTAADDLLQDVFLIFHSRFQRWEFRPEMEAPEARPVLSFLFRTSHFVLRGHRRRLGREDALDDRDVPDAGVAERLDRDVDAARCLDLARRVCPPEELDVLMAKLAAVPAREIAAALGVTEPVVDHRYRDALARLKKGLVPKARRAGRGGGCRG